MGLRGAQGRTVPTWVCEVFVALNDQHFDGALPRLQRST